MTPAEKAEMKPPRFRIVWPDLGRTDGPFASLREARIARKETRDAVGPGWVQRLTDDGTWVRA